MEITTSLEDKTAAAAKSSPEWRSRRETSLGDKAATAKAASSTQEQPRMQIMKGDKLGRQGGSGQGGKQQPRAAQNADHDGRRAWETRRQRQPRTAQNRDHEGRQV